MEKLGTLLQPVVQNLKAGPQSGSLEKPTESTTLSAERFSYHWARLSAAYPRQDNSQATMQVYFDMLRDHAEHEVADAISGCISSLKFFPAISEIKEEIETKLCPHHFKQAELNAKERQIAADVELRKKTLASLGQQCEQLHTEIAGLKVDHRALAEAKAEIIRLTDLPAAEKAIGSLSEQIANATRDLSVLESRRRGFLKQQGEMMGKMFS